MPDPHRSQPSSRERVRLLALAEVVSRGSMDSACMTRGDLPSLAIVSSSRPLRRWEQTRFAEPKMAFRGHRGRFAARRFRKDRAVTPDRHASRRGGKDNVIVGRRGSGETASSTPNKEARRMREPMQFPMSTGGGAHLLGVTEPTLAETIRRGKVDPAPVVLAGRRLWHPQHIRQAAEALGRMTPDLRTSLDSAREDDQAGV